MPRPRARDVGLRPGLLEPGLDNAITDVPGVRVGHVSLVEGDSIRTGVTAILTHDRDPFTWKTPAAAFVLNGFGKFAGLAQVAELGVIETPIALTNTLSVPAAMDGLIGWTLKRHPDVMSVNAVVGECNDGYLNDIRGRHVRPSYVTDAIDAAAPGPVDEGAVGRRRRDELLRIQGRHRHVVSRCRRGVHSRCACVGELRAAGGPDDRRRPRRPRAH